MVGASIRALSTQIAGSGIWDLDSVTTDEHEHERDIVYSNYVGVGELPVLLEISKNGNPLGRAKFSKKRQFDFGGP